MSTQISQSYSFLPTDVADCYIWLDASTSSNFTFSSGSNISTWIDRSGNGFSATATNNPTYDSAAMRVRFNSAASQSMVNLAAPLNLRQRSFFFVIEDVTYVNVGGYMPLIPNPTSGTDYQTTNGLTIENNTGFKWYGNSGGYDNKIVGAAAPNPKGIYSEVFGSLSGTTYYNGTAGGASNSSYTPGTSTGYALGARWANGVSAPFINSYFYEIVVYPTPLSTSQRQQVEGYLAWKWNLTANLPASHPYKQNPPFQNLYPLPQVITSRQPAINNPVFLPTQISGCQLWLDSADSNTVSLLGPRVTQWRDKSGLGNTATPTGIISYTDKINGLSCMVFPGTVSTYFQGTTTNTGTTLTAFSVFLMNSSSYNSARILSLGKDGFFDYNNTQYVAAIERFGTAFDSYRNLQNLGSINATFGAPVLFATLFTGSSNTVFLNGTAGTTVASFGNFGFTTYLVGSSIGEANLVPLNGLIGEVILYSGALTASQRQQVEGYLAWKWGLQANLPSTHSYKNSPFPGLSSAAIPVSPPQITSSIWQPSQLSGTGFTLWLDASDRTTINLLGTQVTQWRDKSGNGNHASATGTISYSGKIGKFAAMSFPGTVSTYFKGSVSNSGPTVTTFAVYVMNPIFYSIIWILSLGVDGQSDTNNTLYTAALLYRALSMTSFRNNALGSSPAVLSAPVLVASIFDGTAQTFFTNGTPGTSAASTGNFGYTTYEVGSGLQAESGTAFDGLIGEVLHFTAALSDIQRQQVEGYLAWKWGLQTSLPGDHPYRNFPPSP